MSPAVWIEPAVGGWRLCGAGRVPGSTWREAHLHLTRGEAQAALAAAIELAAERLPQASAAAQPASRARRGDPASSGLRAPTAGRPVGTAGPGVSAVPAPTTPVPGRATHTDYRATRSQATARAERRTLPSWAPSPGREQHECTWATSTARIVLPPGQRGSNSHGGLRRAGP